MGRDMELPSSSERLRARAVWGLAARSAAAFRAATFRIEDRHGQVLRTIRGARNGQEALALYWRAAGAKLPGTMTGRNLELRIRSVHASSRPTPKLPFDEDGAAKAASPAPRQRRARARSSPNVEQSDLFAEPPSAPADASAHTLAVPVGPPVLDFDTVSLQRVDPRTLRPNDRPDGYLYHVTTAADAAVALRDGLGVSASDPLILSERQGVAYWLSVLAEDYDYILDGPADFVVLRLRRLPVEDLLEVDARASRNAGCPCFLLTGGAAALGPALGR